ncbi:MAG: hypothetical protein PHW60_16715 [Kiritimatiellae bacterium]|nr:hypothetical protein [Kiritimatiellia bacterium]
MKNKRAIIFKVLNKIAALSLIVLLCLPPLAVPFQTFAMFVSNAESGGNRFTAGKLSIEAAASTAGFVPEAIKTGETAYRSITVSNNGSLPFWYRTSVEKIDGNTGACESLRLVARLNGMLVYDGNLLENATSTEFSGSSQIGDSSAVDQWRFETYFTRSVSNVPYDGQCSFKFVFLAGQIGISDSAAGFSDNTEILNNIFLNRAATPNVDVIYPDGGQLWYVVAPQCPNNPSCSLWCSTRNPDPMNGDCQYKIRWTAHNPYGADSDLRIDLYYSNNSGRTWLAPFATNEPNDGEYLWMVPYDTAYVSHTARIKVVAYSPNNPAFTDWAMSERDFCPPMLSMEDLMNQIAAEAETPGGGSSGKPQAESDASVSPSEISPMTAEEINSAIDQIRDATSTEAADDGVSGGAGKSIEIKPFAAPGNSGAGPTIETIAGPPAIIPLPSNEESATSTDTE